MSKINAAITGLGAAVPDYILTNDELSRMVDTSDEWIMTRIGIKERRILRESGKAASDIAVEAVKQLFEKTEVKPEDIDLVICATVTPDMQFPATANIVCDKVGIKNAFSFDINAACSGFLYTLSAAAKFVESGRYKKVIAIGAEKMSSIIDYTDRATCPIFGDGAAAVLLEPTFENVGILDEYLQSDGVGRHHLHLKAGGSLLPASYKTIDNKDHFVYQEGSAVYKWAVTKMSETSSIVMERNNLKPETTWLVPHQANMRIIEAVGSRLQFPVERTMINIQKYGNTTAGTIGLVLSDWESKLKKGDDLLITTFGGGFTWGAMWVKWAY